MIYGALEAGGTKMICAVCKENGEILEQCSIPTREPEITVPEIISYFKDKNIVSLGIACFGPIDLDKDSPTYGYITATPKLQWQNYPLLPVLKEALSVPMGFDTDVNDWNGNRRRGLCERSLASRYAASRAWAYEDGSS